MKTKKSFEIELKFVYTHTHTRTHTKRQTRTQRNWLLFFNDEGRTQLNPKTIHEQRIEKNWIDVEDKREIFFQFMCVCVFHHQSQQMIFVFRSNSIWFFSPIWLIIKDFFFWKMLRSFLCVSAVNQALGAGYCLFPSPYPFWGISNDRTKQN